MSGTSYQNAVDVADAVAWTSDDVQSAQAAETTRNALAEHAGLHVYCPLHRANHLLNLLEVERLLACLQASWSDEVADCMQGETPDFTPDEVLGFCPLSLLRMSYDSEGYVEHCDSIVESRRASELAALQPGGHS